MKKPAITLLLAACTLAACTKATNTTGPTVTETTTTVQPAQWGYKSPSNYVDITETAITQDVINTGAIAVSVSPDGANWINLPATDWGTPSATYTVGYYLGTVEIDLTNTSGTNTPPAAPVLVKVTVTSK